MDNGPQLVGLLCKQKSYYIAHYYYIFFLLCFNCNLYFMVFRRTSEHGSNTLGADSFGPIRGEFELSRSKGT